MRRELNEKEQAEMSRRGFLKRAALAGAAICVAPTLETVTADRKSVV